LEIVYTPPEGEAIIRDKLSNLESFIHAEDGLDPLVRLAAGGCGCYGCWLGGSTVDIEVDY